LVFTHLGYRQSGAELEVRSHKFAESKLQVAVIVSNRNPAYQEFLIHTFNRKSKNQRQPEPGRPLASIYQVATGLAIARSAQVAATTIE
jgi:hypothetical protein